MKEINTIDQIIKDEHEWTSLDADVNVFITTKFN
jgi:hypothetical protein